MLMKHIVASFAILLLCVAATGDDAQIVRQVTDMNSILQAATAHYDSSTISNFMADDYTLIDSATGEVWSKNTFLQVVANRAASNRTVDPSDVSVRSYNGDCAIVVGLLHVKFTVRGKTTNQMLRFTDTWVKRDGSWHYVAGAGVLYKKL